MHYTCQRQENTLQAIEAKRLAGHVFDFGHHIRKHRAIFHREPNDKWNGHQIRIGGASPIGRTRCLAMVGEIDEENRSVHPLEPFQDVPKERIGESDGIIIGINGRETHRRLSIFKPRWNIAFVARINRTGRRISIERDGMRPHHMHKHQPWRDIRSGYVHPFKKRWKQRVVVTRTILSGIMMFCQIPLFGTSAEQQSLHVVPAPPTRMCRKQRTIVSYRHALLDKHAIRSVRRFHRGIGKHHPQRISSHAMRGRHVAKYDQLVLHVLQAWRRRAGITV